VSPAGYRIEGHAIVSADDCIADASGAMPHQLRNDADWGRFQAALDEAVVVVLGRRSHEASPNTRRRNRMVVSSSAAGVERREDAWWWNPETAPLEIALRDAAPAGGIVAVPGGRRVFDLFLAIGYDAFYLARAAHVRLPGGTPLFGADGLLAAAGMTPHTHEILDETADVTLVTWRSAGA
jgi:dihydrofolate reductase